MLFDPPHQRLAHVLPPLSLPLLRLYAADIIADGLGGHHAFTVEERAFESLQAGVIRC